MKNIQVEILSVGQPKHMPVPGKAGYFKMDVAYKDNGKVGGRPFVSFKEPQVFEALKELKPGDTISVGMEKEAGSDGREYWVWKEITKVEGDSSPEEQTSSTPRSAPQTSQTATPNSTGAKAVGKVIGSNYETPEERARKQVFIVRQSSIDQARSYLEGTDSSFDEIFKLATTIEDYIFNGYEKIYEDGGIQKEASKSQESPKKQTDSLGTSEASSQQAGVLKRRGRPPKLANASEASPVDAVDDIPF
jgi:hypothetical protein